MNSDSQDLSKCVSLRAWGQLFLLLLLLALVACGGGGGTSSGPFTAGRTKYVRTDATTEYFQWINSHWIISALNVERLTRD
jgi:hypothetical protein